MKVHYVKLGFLALLFICLYSTVDVGHAEVVWSDDFEDGDIEGWNIVQGNLSAEDGTLRSTVEGSVEYISPEYKLLSLAYHPSTVSVGTWSFDFLLDYSTDIPEMTVNFISLNQFTWVWLSRGQCYGVYVGWSNPDKIELFRDVNYPKSPWTRLSPAPNKPNTWYHVDVTRDDEGRIRVYLDGVLKINEVETTHSESYFLGVMLEHSSRGNAVIDNIVVSDTIDIEPPPKTERKGIPSFPFESIMIGAIGGVFILWLMLRRKLTHILDDESGSFSIPPKYRNPKSD